MIIYYIENCKRFQNNDIILYCYDLSLELRLHFRQRLESKKGEMAIGKV